MTLKYIKNIYGAVNKKRSTYGRCGQDLLRYLGHFESESYKTSILFKGGLYLHELLEGSDIVHEQKEPPPRVSRAFGVHAEGSLLINLVRYFVQSLIPTEATKTNGKQFEI